MGTALLIWLVCAIGAAILAGQKNRSQGGWFVAGIVFGPFALLFILVTDTVNPRAKEEEWAAREALRKFDVELPVPRETSITDETAEEIGRRMKEAE